MKRRTLFKTTLLGVVNYLMPRFGRAQSGVLSQGDRELVAAIGDVALPSSLGADGRAKAVASFEKWLDGYQAGGPMSHGYGSELRYSVVPLSPLLRYPAQFARLQELSRAKGSAFTALSPADRAAVLEAALREARVAKLPERPDGQHIASDLMGHFYNSSDGNDFLFKAAIRVSDCRGLATSADKPASLS